MYHAIPFHYCHYPIIFILIVGGIQNNQIIQIEMIIQPDKHQCKVFIYLKKLRDTICYKLKKVIRKG